jgi:hypothetical protein
MTDSMTKNKNIDIDGQTFEIIEGTQSDGRCFSASIYYDLYEEKATDVKLNDWIQVFIIDPILKTETTNCPEFFNWAINWVGIHNEEDNKEVNEDIITMHETFDKINITIKRINDFLTIKEPTQENLNDIKQILQNNELTTKKDIEEIKNNLKQNGIEMCNELLKNPNYLAIINQYKDYISSLNKQKDDNTYEWTEPEVGPIQVLLSNTSIPIKSIHIYDKSNNAWSHMDNNDIIKDGRKDLYLFYENGNHYKPLIKGGNSKEELETQQVPEIETQVSEEVPILNPLDEQDQTNEEQTLIQEQKTEEQKTEEQKTEEQKTEEQKTEEQKTEEQKTSQEQPKKPNEQKTSQEQPKKPNEQKTSQEQPKKPNEQKTSQEQPKKPNEQTTNKEEKVPNSVIIKIKTRIPNYLTFNYEPYMSVPSVKSQTVYFNPLVKYYEKPISRFPEGTPKDAILTQFFNANEFETMIHKILSSYWQKPITLKEAYDKHIIDNNMKITLNTLFKPNNVIYIGSKPYTIVSTNSKPWEWKLDKKPMDKLLNQFPHLNAKQLKEDIEKEKKLIPKEITLTTIEEPKKIDINNINNNDNNDNSDKIKTTTSFIPKDKLSGEETRFLRKLYTKYLQENGFINYSKNQDISKDPYTLSLLIDPEQLLEYVKSIQNKKLIDLYAEFNKSKETLKEADEMFKQLCAKLAKYDKIFKEQMTYIQKQIEGNSETEISKNSKNFVQKIIEKIIGLKIDYMKIIFELADAVNNIYSYQEKYFVSMKHLLEQLKKDYSKIIKYYEEPELALKCIDDDLYTFGLFIQEDKNNPYSQSYFRNYNKFKQSYDFLKQNKQMFLEPPIYDEKHINIYNKYPYTLSIEIYQYELYFFNIIYYYYYNQLDVWATLFHSTQIFVDVISMDASNIIKSTDDSLQQLNTDFSVQKQRDIIQEIGASGIKSTDKKQGAKWYLVDNSGNRLIHETKNQKYAKFEELYIEYNKLTIKSYDAFILYIYLLEIQCLREIKVNIAEKNIFQLNIDFSVSLNKYYNIIKDQLPTNNETTKKTDNETTDIYIPPSILWNIENFKDLKILENNIQINNKTYYNYVSKKNHMSKIIEKVNETCEKIKSQITPNIKKDVFIKGCNAVITENKFSKKYLPKNDYWINKSIKHYDIQNTNDFIYNIRKIIKDTLKQEPLKEVDIEVKPNEYVDWMVFKNDAKNIEDSLYASVADGLNAQLNILGMDTENPYTETIDGKQMFTIKSLKDLIGDTDATNKKDINDIFTQLQEKLEITFIVFEMFERDKSAGFSIGDTVLYKDDDKDDKDDKNDKKHLYRIVNIIKKSYDLYDIDNGYKQITGQEKISYYEKNILNHFRIQCLNKINDKKDDKKDDKKEEFMYLLLTNPNNTNKMYQMIQKINANCIFHAKDIPIYIKYFMFYSCPNMTIGNEDFKEFEKTRNERINKSVIENDIKKTKQNIKKIKKELKANSNNGENISILRVELNEKLKKLKQRLKTLKKIDLDTPITTGGAVTFDPKVEIIPPVPGQQPYLVPGQQLYTVPGQQLYSVPGQQPYFRQIYDQNKLKDQKSKMSFYITIELDLFPGKNVNALQKSAVKCRSTFERIREAWAEIFGYQYRPLPMVEPYSNNEDNEKEKEKEKENVGKVIDKEEIEKKT